MNIDLTVTEPHFLYYGYVMLSVICLGMAILFARKAGIYADKGNGYEGKAAAFVASAIAFSIAFVIQGIMSLSMGWEIFAKGLGIE